MSLPSPKPAVSVTAAVVIALVAFSIAAVADAMIVSALCVIVGAASAVWLVRSAGRQSSGAGLLGVVLVPVLMLGVGTTVVAVASEAVDGPSSGTSTAGADTPGDGAEIDGFDDLDQRFQDALAHADTLVPRGSSSILSITLGEHNDGVAVLDPATGMRVYANRSDEWGEPSRTSWTQRTTFTRDDVAAFRPQAALVEADAAARTIGVSDEDRNDPDGITIGPRSEPDRMVIAEFAYGSFEHVQIDMAGTVADTLDAGALETMLTSAQRVMEANGLDPDDRSMRRLDFKSSHANSSSIGATSVQNSGGVELGFDTGPIENITIVLGEFPVVRKRTSTSQVRDGTFTLSEVTPQILSTIRSDLMRRAGSPAYDKDAIGLRVGSTYLRGTVNDYVTVITMQVGPSSADAEGVYTMAGVHLPDD